MGSVFPANCWPCGISAGDVPRDGTGQRNDPDRYWLKGQEEKWKAEDPLWEYRQEGKKVLQVLRDSIHGRPGREERQSRGKRGSSSPGKE